MWKSKLFISLFLAIIPSCVFAQDSSGNNLVPVAAVDCSQEQFDKAEKAFRGRSLGPAPEKALKTLVNGCPNESWIDTASAELTTVQEESAEHSINIGLYYQQKFEKGESTSNRGAFSRFEYVLREYPHYAHTDRVLLILGNAYLSTNQWEEAFATYTRLINEFPTSVFAGDAFKQLNMLAKKSIEPTTSK